MLFSQGTGEGWPERQHGQLPLESVELAGDPEERAVAGPEGVEAERQRRGLWNLFCQRGAELMPP